jgi:hypothetical protein
MPDDANIIERPNSRIALAEAILCDLGELRHRGMNVARATSDQACRESEAAKDGEAGPERPTGRGAAEAFNRASRNVRVNAVLELRVADYLAALRAGDPNAEFWPRRARQNARASDPSQPEPDRVDLRDSVHGSVLEVLDPELLDSDEGERIYEDLNERLYETERYDEFLDLPREDLVELICKDLGVKPDWQRFYDYEWPPWRTAKTRRPPTPPNPGKPPGEPPPDGALLAVGVSAPPPPDIPDDLYSASG